jgi:hypothetical protein
VMIVGVHLSKYATNVYWVKKKMFVTVFVLKTTLIQTASGVFSGNTRL